MILTPMILVGRDTLLAFAARERRHAANRAAALDKAIASWTAEAAKAQWRHAMDVKAMYRSADPVGGNRVVFDLCGNRYRLVVRVNYAAKVVEVRFIGTHDEYNAIDARTV